MSPFQSAARWVAALLFLMMIQGAALFFWAQKNSSPLAWDQAIHTKIAMDYRDRIGEDSLLDLLRPKSFSYPPLYHLAMAPTLGLVSEVAEAGLPVNFFYTCLLILAVFMIGLETMGAWEGFTAAAIASCYPLIVNLGRTTLIDLSLSAWVAVVFYCLVRSRHFESFLFSVLFGVSLGFAMLTKWTAFVYLAFPALFSIGIALRERRWKNIALAGVGAAVVMAPWYAQNLIPVLIQIPILSGLPPASGENMSGLANVFWYPLSIHQQTGTLFVVLFLPGLAVVAWRPKLFPVVLWLFGSLFLFSLIRNKNIRYFAPALPALALLTAAWLPSWKRVSYGVVLLGVAVSFFNHNRNNAPSAQDWHHEEIIVRVLGLHGKGPKPANVLIVANGPFFHGASLRMTARSLKISDVTFHSPSKSRPFEFADFVLTKTGDLGPAFTLGSINKAADVIRKPEEWFADTYKEVGRWPLPDGSEAVLYHCDPTPKKIPDAGLFNLSLKVMELPHIQAFGVDLRAEPLSLADTQAGRLKELKVRCERLVYKNIEFRGVMVRLVRPQINLPLFFETQQLQLLRLETLEPHATISASDLLTLASRKAPWLSEPAVTFNGSAVDISGRAYGIPVALGADMKVENKMFVSKLRRASVAGVPVPTIFLRAMLNQSVPLSRGAEWGYNIEISEIHGDGSSLRIGAK